MIPAVSELHVAPVSYARLRAGSGQPAQAWRPVPLRDILPKRIWHNVVERFRMNVTNVQMGDWLGQRAPATETEVLRIVEGKLAPTVIKRLISLGLQRSEIDAAIIPLRTLQHRRSRREKRPEWNDGRVNLRALQ